jgi:hypothetical protein
MVSTYDFGIREREQMVRLAIWQGWIFKANKQARDNGVADPVVVLVAIDALELVPFRFDCSPRQRRLERLQRNARCKRFTIGVVSYAALLRGNAADGWQDDMEDMRRKGGTAVVCINSTGQFLCAVHPEHPRPNRDFWDSYFLAAENDADGE